MTAGGHAPRRIVFLMSDSGGGHRSAAQAIRAALQQRYPGRYRYELVDVYRRYTPFPFRYMPEIYPRWVNWANRSWGASFWATNTPVTAAVMVRTLDQLWQRGIGALVRDHPADVWVSVHTMFSRPVRRALEWSRTRAPFVTVLTDLVTVHAAAYVLGADRCLVPTPAAYARGLALGMQPHQLRLTGLPVHPDFLHDLQMPSGARAEARRALGWPQSRPVVLVTGGGDGMGPVYRIARALDARRLPVHLVIVTGRNAALLRRLQAARWHTRPTLYPFVSNMPQLMAAADLLVTKAGPSTLAEACIAGLPLVLSGHVRGQEDGNIGYIVEHGAGVYAPRPAVVADAVAAWLSETPAARAERALAARRLAYPDAVWDVADEIHHQAQRGRLPVRQRVTRPTGPRDPHLRHAPEDGWLL